jgi:uncharacterized protein DUF2213
MPPDTPAQDRIAFDFSSARTKDADGHLHVSGSPISKSNVCEYLGEEIPDAEKLGLDPKKRYRLLRDPKELEKAAPTFEGKPLLIIHRPQTADDHERRAVVGSLDGVKWDGPHLRANLHVWDGDAIKGIENDSQRELSSGYHYDPDMTPGKFEGESYDGVMRNIRGNHVALVEKGRAGSDVMVGDADPAQDLPGQNHDPATGQFSSTSGSGKGSGSAGKSPPPAGSKKAFRAEVGGYSHTFGSLQELKEWVRDLRKKAPGIVGKDLTIHEGEMLPKGGYSFPQGHPTKTLKVSSDSASDMAIDALIADSTVAIDDADLFLEIQQETTPMKTAPLSRKALALSGALAAYALPKLAKDAKLPDFSPVVKGVTAKNFAVSKGTISDRVQIALKGRLAQDASLQDMHTFLDSMEKEGEGQDDGPPKQLDPAGVDPQRSTDNPEVNTLDAGGLCDKICAALEGAVGPDVLERIREVCEQGGADEEWMPTEDEMKDKTPEEREKMMKEAKDRHAKDMAAKDKAAKDKAARDKRARDAESPEQRAEREDNEKKKAAAEARDKAAKDKKAMDAALKQTRDETIKLMREINDAEQFVTPWIGKVADQDTPGAYYKLALDSLGIDVDGIHESAWRKLLEREPKPGDPVAAPRHQQQMAHDSATAAGSLRAALPELTRFKRVA